MWSDKTRHHLTSLYESIWDIVEYGAQVPQVGDKDYDSDEAAQIRHFTSQATSILLASLCREEYNKLQGLKSAKEIWDVLKTTHEGDEVTNITKRETIEGELGRFVLNKGEESQAMYNRLKTMVNQVRCNTPGVTQGPGSIPTLMTCYHMCLSGGEGAPKPWKPWV
jgi:hypothetical protein